MIPNWLVLPVARRIAAAQPAAAVWTAHSVLGKYLRTAADDVALGRSVVKYLRHRMRFVNDELTGVERNNAAQREMLQEWTRL